MCYNMSSRSTNSPFFLQLLKQTPTIVLTRRIRVKFVVPKLTLNPTCFGSSLTIQWSQGVSCQAEHSLCLVACGRVGYTDTKQYNVD